MSRRILIFSSVGLVIISWLLYNSCMPTKFQFNRVASGNNTILGNPLSKLDSGQILYAVCDVLRRCNSSLQVDACTAGILGVSGVDFQVGLPLGVYQSYLSIVQAESSGFVSGNTAATQSCLASINALACSAPQVQRAYSPLDPNPFSGVAAIFPLSCTGVFNSLGLGWRQLPNTLTTSVCPPSNSSYDYGNLCQRAISTWSGGIADTTNDRLLFWGGGGATDYAGNEVYSLNLKSQTLTRLTNPGPFSASCVETLADGTPAARSTFSDLAYIPYANKMFSYGGSLYGACRNSNATWTLDLASLTWKSMEPHNGGTPNAYAGNMADYDPNSKLVFLEDTLSFWSYNYNTNTYTLLNNFTQTDFNMTGVVDPNRKLFIMIGGLLSSSTMGGIKVVDISQGGGYTFQNWTPQVSGCDALATADGPGLAYDPILNLIVGWAGGDTVYLFDPDTKTCRPVTYPNGPGPAQPNGTYGRWRYFPDQGVFSLVNDGAQNAFVMKLTQ